MDAIELKSNLPAKLVEALRDVLSYFSVRHVADRIWSEVLSSDEQTKLGEQYSPQTMIQHRAKTIGCSFERAMLDLALEASVIDVACHRRLRRGIGEPVEGSRDGPRQVWNAEAGELFYRGVLIRKVSPQGTAIRRILDAFEEQHWARRIVNPYLGYGSSALRETVRSLNGSGLKDIKFFADGTATGVLWQEVEPP